MRSPRTAAAQAVTLPAGFSDAHVATVAAPTAIAFTPDGRMLIATQPGAPRVRTAAGSLLSTPALSLAAKVCANRDRGLLGSRWIRASRPTATSTCTTRSTRSTTPARVGNTPPAPATQSPAAGQRFAVGETLALRGSATDAQYGTLPPSALSWTLLRRHGTHTHPYLGPVAGNASSLSTSPSGLTLSLNGTPFTAPRTWTSWEAWNVTADASNQGNSAFSSWSDGGAATHTIRTPATPTGYTATFVPASVTVNDAKVGTTSGTFAYAGTWGVGTGTAKYQGDDHYSATTSSSYTLRFAGTQVALYGAKAAHHGQASVQIDGGSAVTIDQYAATRQENALVYRSPVLVSGEHTVKVTVKGTHQAASTGNVIAIDRAVYSTPPLFTINDARTGTTSGTFAYAGTWGIGTGTAKYLGDDHYSATTGSSYTLRFRGTRLALYGAKASHHGQASVQIDAGTVSTIDQYAGTRQENVLVYRSGVLSSAEHTAKVTVKGTRSSASTGYVVTVDRAVVTG